MRPPTASFTSLGSRSFCISVRMFSCLQCKVCNSKFACRSFVRFSVRLPFVSLCHTAAHALHLRRIRIVFLDIKINMQHWHTEVVNFELRMLLVSSSLRLGQRVQSEWIALKFKPKFGITPLASSRLPCVELDVALKIYSILFKDKLRLPINGPELPSSGICEKCSLKNKLNLKKIKF